MSDLTSSDRRKLERLFEMSSGYVLDFSNRTFADFVEEQTGRDIYDDAYSRSGGSKANRLRAFWSTESNGIVGRLIGALVAHREEVLEEQRRTQVFGGLSRLPDEARLAGECGQIARRLIEGSAVEDLDALRAPSDEPGFATVAEQVRDCVARGRPEAGLDRLHTFVVKFVRSLCSSRGVGVERDKPLHSLFGEYVKALRSKGHLESRMTERILKSTISTLELFNEVRNERSLAHDNPLLNREESLLVLGHVSSTVRFLSSLEERLSKQGTQRPEDDIAF